MTPLQTRTLERAEAAASLPVREQPPGSNSGPEVNQYLAFVGLRPGNPWCAAFASFCIHRAAEEVGVTCQFPITGSSSAIWRWASKTGNLLAVPVPGCVGLVRGGSTGWEHTFLVRDVDTAEGLVRSYDGNFGSKVQHCTHLIRTSAFVRIL